MSNYTPSYKQSDRWLSRGIPLDSTKLDTELDNVATAINTGDLGGADLTFEPGWGIIYDRNEHATGKWSAIADASAGTDLISINIESTTGITFSDTTFNYISLDTASTAYGSKWMHLGLNFYFVTTSPAVRHPAHASYTDSLGIVIREQSDQADITTGIEGHHPLAVAADTDFGAAATGVHYRSVYMRNINQGFAIRIGSGLTIGTGSRLLVRVTGLGW